MSVSDDIGNLFQRFGGNPDRYQEVARDDDAKHAASRWPLLSAVDIAQPEQVPGAGRPAPARPAVQALSPAAASAEDSNVTPDPVAAASPRSPLFARGHRHAMMPPPVDATRQATSRFSQPPQAETAAAASDAEAAPRQHAEPGPVAVVAPASRSTLRTSGTPASAPPTAHAVPSASTVPAADPHASNDASREASRRQNEGFFANRKQTFAPAPITDAIEIGRAPAPTGAQRSTQAPAQPQAQSRPYPQPQPASQAPAQRSILSGLFAAAPAHEPEPSPRPTTRELTTVFARLAAAPRRGDKTPGGERS
jgi:hypothetical protein